MRVAVYTDYTYQRRGGRIFGDRAFAVFLDQLRPHLSGLTLVGRLRPGDDQARYPVGDDVELLELPYYERLSRPFAVLPALARSLGLFWRSLPEVDAVWVLGPHPLATAFAILAKLRRKRVILGVRQDMQAYVSSRHPRRWDLRLAALVLEGSFRLLARFLPVVVVGPDLGKRYSGAKALLELTVVLLSQADVAASQRAAEVRSYAATLDILVVGRIESEKNPLLLAEVLARLNEGEPRWRMRICGEGAMRPELEKRLGELSQAEHAEFLGYVPFGPGLLDLYRQSHVFLHVSWTEGLPQVLVEALGCGLPIVATDVGGVREAMGSAVRLVAAGDADQAAAELARVATDEPLRRELIASGFAFATQHTSEAELSRLAGFLSA